MCACVCVCVHRHRGKIHDMGADQEGAWIITAQSQAEKNHNKLYHRWVKPQCPGLLEIILRLWFCPVVSLIGQQSFKKKEKETAPKCDRRSQLFWLEARFSLHLTCFPGRRSLSTAASLFRSEWIHSLLCSRCWCLIHIVNRWSQTWSDAALFTFPLKILSLSASRGSQLEDG